MADGVMAPMGNRPGIVPCGDRTALIRYPGGIDPKVNGWVRSTAQLLRRMRHPALGDTVIAYATLLVEYDPVLVGWESLTELLDQVVEQAERLPPPPGKDVQVPVLYGGEAGPDLANVAELTGLTVAEVVRRHTGRGYLVYALGFSPGFCYLGGLDPELAVPRLDVPRTRVAAGSVGIGGSQTGVYPSETPGGWRILGRTSMPLFDPDREPPSPVAPGDTIHFRAVTELPAVAPKAAAPVPEPRPGQSGLRVIQPGLSTTVQDAGRRGYRDLGVPVSGAADVSSLQVGNWLLGNAGAAAALELTLLGGEYEFTGPAAFCLAGAEFAAELLPAGGGAARRVDGWTVAPAAAGDRLRIGAALSGCRGYLCVAGGIDVPPVLGSRSTDTLGGLGPLGGRALQPGDWLPCGAMDELPPARSLPPEWRPRLGGDYVIRVVLGPQADAFTPAGIKAFLSGTYEVMHQSNRVGVRLSGPAITPKASSDILTEGMPLGGIQVPKSGQPILMLAGRQATGGYAKVAVAIATDMSSAAQMRPGDRVRFEAVDLAGAHRIVRAEAERLQSLRRAIAAMPAAGRPLADVLAAAAADPATGAATAAAVGGDPSTTGSPDGSGRRHLRIRIGGVEFAAQIEEVD